MENEEEAWRKIVDRYDPDSDPPVNIFVEVLFNEDDSESHAGLKCSDGEFYIKDLGGCDWAPDFWRPIKPEDRAKIMSHKEQACWDVDSYDVGDCPAFAGAEPFYLPIYETGYHTDKKGYFIKRTGVKWVENHGRT